MASQILKKSKTELQHTLKNNLEESVKIFNRLSEEQRKTLLLEKEIEELRKRIEQLEAISTQQVPSTQETHESIPDN